MNLLAREPVVIRRYLTAQTFDADGLLVANTPTEIPAFASVQPDTRRTIITDPGFSDTDLRMLYLFTEVRGVGEASGLPPDEVVWIGAIWRVFTVDAWPALGPIPAHWEVGVQLVQPLVPAG